MRNGWCRAVAMLLAVVSAVGMRGQAAALAPGQDAALAEARSLFTRGAYAQADRVLRGYVAAHPTAAEALYLLAFTQQRENQPRASLATYNAAAKLTPPSGEQLRQVSLNYVLLDDHPDALHWLEHAVAADPKNAEAWYDLGRVRMHDGRFDLAAQALRRSLALRPGDARALGNLGKCLENQNRIEEALAAYADAVKAAEAKPVEQPFLDYGALLNTRNRFAEALPLLQRATQLAAADAHAWEELARAQAGLNRQAEAAASLEKAVAAEPGNSRLHYQLARVYRTLGREEQARQEFAKSAALYGGKSAE